MGNVFTLSRLGSGHVSKHFGIGGVTHNATDVTDFLGRNQFLNWEMRKNSIKSERRRIKRKRSIKAHKFGHTPFKDTLGLEGSRTTQQTWLISWVVTNSWIERWEKTQLNLREEKIKVKGVLRHIATDVTDFVGVAQSYEIKLPPRVILGFKILEIFSVEN